MTDIDYIDVDRIIESLDLALKRRGWTPPGESEWLRLDECDFELNGDFLGPVSDEGVTHIGDFLACLFTEGFSAVQIRRKR